MGNNSLGRLFTITTWGESHGPAVGVVIDGCPAGLPLDIEEINTALARRAPGRGAYTSPRQEPDHAKILSGVFEGKTTGAPVSLLIENKDVNSSHYTALQKILRPGHANFTYLEKYGVFDHRGGGRASARETVCRVAAGAVAQKLLAHHGISLIAYLEQIGTAQALDIPSTIGTLRSATYASPLFCPDARATQEMTSLLNHIKAQGDSLGGIVSFQAHNLPVGLGDPIYEKLEANLAHAMMSLPASKGFELGSGFQAATMRGSEHNDTFIHVEGSVQTISNHAGGTLGGISTGMPLIGRVAFKPTSSIRSPQKTLTTQGEETMFQLPEGSRHDPCVAIRAVPVVEAMLALVLADSLLISQCTKL